MQYVQVNLLQTWKIAAFLVAFFSSFFSLAEIDYSSLDGKPPQVTPDEFGTCQLPDGPVTGQKEGDCMSLFTSFYKGVYSPDATLDFQEIYRDPTAVLWNIKIDWVDINEDNRSITQVNQQINNIGTVLTKACPSDSYPQHTFAYDIDGDDEVDVCYHPNDVQELINRENELDKNEDYCKDLVIDSGNNSASSMCYTAYNGASCSVSKVQVGDASYYKGTGNNPLGCGSSNDPPYDNSGTGDDKDGCVYSNGTNYCKANEDKHCSTTQGTKICDDGCIDDGENVYCDTSKHNDVGEGESDYHDGNGTCSVIAASSSKGFCEDMGGNWDGTQDATETDCPAGTGSCSVQTAGHCGACLDDGGVWTPDNTIPVSEETKASVEVATQVKKTNDKLTQIEAGQRSTMETTVSTIKSGNGKIVAAIEELTKITKDASSGGAAPDDEKESYTTTTGDIDKTKINALYDAAHLAQLKNGDRGFTTTN